MDGQTAEKLEHFTGMMAALEEKAGLRTGILTALALTENRRIDPFARRVEPAFYERYLRGREEWVGHPWYAFPEVIAASYGLTQVMFTTALWVRDRELPPFRPETWDGTPWGLFDPLANLEIGTAVLAHKIKRYGERDGVAAYNAGSPRRPPGETRLENEGYVQRFERNLWGPGQEPQWMA